MITQPGTFRVTASLQASNGNLIGAGGLFTLPSGPGTVVLKYPAQLIVGQLGVDGPYTIVNLDLAAQDPASGEFQVSTHEDVGGTTSPWTLREFEQPWASLTGTFSCVGVSQTNGNGLSGILADVGVNLLAQGTYTISAQLADANGNLITNSQPQSLFLPAGPNTLVLSFPGAPIAASQAPAPFQVRSLVIRGFTSVGFGTVGTITGFTWSQFQ